MVSPKYHKCLPFSTALVYFRAFYKNNYPFKISSLHASRNVHPAFSFLVKTSQNSVKKRKLFEPKQKLNTSDHERSATNAQYGPPNPKASFFGLAIF